MTSALDHASLNVESNLENLARVRRFVRNFLTPYAGRLAAERIDLVELAANELVTNIVRHAYQGRPDHPITIAAVYKSDRIELLFEDQGEAWDSQVAIPPAFDGTREGGFGLYIISQAVDRVAYSRTDNGTNCACLTIMLQEETDGV